MRFSVSHADESRFESDGLRPFFEYRDLGIAEATDGRFLAHVIRAKPGHHAAGGWHRHDLGFQLVYVLKGWVKFRYEGQGEVTLKAGTCVHQPPGIRHVEVEHSDDLELIEITMPAEFATESVPAPEAEPAAAG
ncbi:hypothetical protein STAQ_40600 [Allostella sp. ATCC 35155]|nr:hypothetical protein STAQ_40600 [Stella sp. ATCC 35155]